MHGFTVAARTQGLRLFADKLAVRGVQQCRELVASETKIHCLLGRMYRYPPEPSVLTYASLV